jgi:hypothetical protein
VRPAVLLLAACLSLAATALAQEATNRDQSSYTELHEEGFPLRFEPAAVPAAEARLLDDEIVIGVVAGGRSRAYPVNLMWKPQNESLNDTLGGEAIAVTWCPVAHSAAVYDRSLDGKPVDLGAIGLERGVFVLYDRQTRSWWSQVTGSARSGPLAGRSLAKRTSVLTTWGRWRQLHPDTTVFVDPSLPARRRFTEESLSRITLGGAGAVLNQDLVLGVESGTSARAFLLRRLAEERVANDALDGEPVLVSLAEDQVTATAWRRRVGGRTLTFASLAGDRLKDAQTGSTWDALTGRALSGPLSGQQLEPLVFTYALWYAWRSQRPGTTLWGEKPAQEGMSERPASVPPQ